MPVAFLLGTSLMREAGLTTCRRRVGLAHATEHTTPWENACLPPALRDRPVRCQRVRARAWQVFRGKSTEYSVPRTEYGVSEVMRTGHCVLGTAYPVLSPSPESLATLRTLGGR